MPGIEHWHPIASFANTTSISYATSTPTRTTPLILFTLLLNLKMRSHVVAAYVVAILSAGLPAFGTPVPLAAAVGKVPPSIHPHITVCIPT